MALLSALNRAPSQNVCGCGTAGGLLPAAFFIRCTFTAKFLMAWRRVIAQGRENQTFLRIDRRFSHVDL